MFHGKCSQQLLVVGVPTLKKFQQILLAEHISNNFLQGFQKRQYNDNRTMLLYMQALTTQPTYLLSYRLHGLILRVEGVCLIKKLRMVLILELKNKLLRISCQIP